MKLHEFMNMGNPTIIEQARKIDRIWSFHPISQKDMSWLVRLSKDESFIGKLYWHSQQMNRRSPIQTDHQFLNDSGTCASAYKVLREIQAQIMSKKAQIHQKSGISH